MKQPDPWTPVAALGAGLDSPFTQPALNAWVADALARMDLSGLLEPAESARPAR